MDNSRLLSDRQVYSSERNEFVSENMMTLATVIHDYNPNLSLVYIPPKDRDATDIKPYAIVENRPGFPTQPIRFLSEREIQDRQGVLAWVFAGDLTKHKPEEVIRNIELQEAAAEALRLKHEEEEAEDRIALGAFMFSGGRDRKNYIRHNGQTFRR